MVLSGYSLGPLLLLLVSTMLLIKPPALDAAIPALLLVMAYPPRIACFWGRIAVGALGSGGVAGWGAIVTLMGCRLYKRRRY